MITYHPITNAALVEVFSFASFCEEVQPLVLKGYTFDLETNEGYPTAYSGHFFCKMNPPNDSSKNATESDPSPSDGTEETVARRGRKAKVVTE